MLTTDLRSLGPNAISGGLPRLISFACVIRMIILRVGAAHCLSKYSHILVEPRLADVFNLRCQIAVDAGDNRPRAN